MGRTKTTLTKWMDEKRRRFLEEEGAEQSGFSLTEQGDGGPVTRRAIDLQWKLWKSTR